ncbi:YgfZ/GcvT domain-containing protein [Rhodoluna lacicola]|uniref:CAF17-like 4Fe-4S cluster assembly/insertion protein YgfZ n=1 Tax=Rhodoluna lacicola TaxID=529884 RepID=UPI00222FC6A5|nr:folate-binding protein [Rhodoluna lacicola]BDS50081.1 folate-binding protein [Rhodoluna lacicola]
MSAAEQNAKEHFGNPNIEQRNLAAGTAAVDLGARGIITVNGPDRLDWLHSLLSQNLKNLLPGVSAEALLLDPNGHIEQVIHFLDDGETSWLVIEAEGRESFLAWLSKMIFRMKVEVADRSNNFSVIGQIGAGIPQAYVSNGVALIWQDPWPGVVTGGVRYSMARPAKWQWTESLVEVNKVEAVLAEFEKAGTMAYDALRLAAHRPRQLTEVDTKALPHEFDWMSTAVHMSKGCYRGQETVAKVHNLGHPPRRLTFLHLDGSGHFLPSAGDEVFVVGENGVVEERSRGHVTIAAQHFESGPIALALLSRSVPEDAPLVVRGESGEIDAAQEVIVPASAGKAANLPKRNLLMGGKH